MDNLSGQLGQLVRRPKTNHKSLIFMATQTTRLLLMSIVKEPVAWLAATSVMDRRTHGQMLVPSSIPVAPQAEMIDTVRSPAAEGFRFSVDASVARCYRFNNRTA
jgi:hypothetical protein